MAVKDQDASGCPRHDARRQSHQPSGQLGLATAETAGKEHAKRPLQLQVMRLIPTASGGIVVGDGGCHIASWVAGRQPGRLRCSLVQQLCVDVVIRHVPFKVHVG